MSGPVEDLELARLRADSPGWEIWADARGVYIAWLAGTLLVLRAATVPGLRAAIEAQTGGKR
jgi:hypothetical protein